MTGTLLFTYIPLIIALTVILAVFLREYYKNKKDADSVKIKVGTAVICALSIISIFFIIYMTSIMDPAANLSEDDAKILVSNEIKDMPEFSGPYGLIGMTNTSFINKSSDFHFDITKWTFINNDQAYASFIANYTINKDTTGGNSKLGRGTARFTWDNEKNEWTVEITEFKAIN